MSATIVPYVNNLPINDFICGEEPLVIGPDNVVSLWGKTTGVDDDVSVEWEWTGGNISSNRVISANTSNLGTITYTFKVMPEATITCSITITVSNNPPNSSMNVDGHFVLTDCTDSTDIFPNQSGVAETSLYPNTNAQVKFVIDTIPTDGFVYYTYIWGSSVIANPIPSENTSDTITVNVQNTTQTAYFLTVTDVSSLVSVQFWLVVNNSALATPPVTPLVITELSVTLPGEDPRTGTCGSEFFIDSWPEDPINATVTASGGTPDYTQTFDPNPHAETANSKTYVVTVTDESCQEQKCFFTLTRGLSVSSLLIDSTPVCCGAIFKTCCPMASSTCTFEIAATVQSNQYTELLYRIIKDGETPPILDNSLTLTNMQGTTETASLTLSVNQEETEVCVEFYVMNGDDEVIVTSCCATILREDCTIPYANIPSVVVDGLALNAGSEYSHCCTDSPCEVPVSGILYSNQFSDNNLSYRLLVDGTTIIPSGTVTFVDDIGTTPTTDVTLVNESTQVCFEYYLAELEIVTGCVTIKREDCSCPELTVSNFIMDDETVTPVACGGVFNKCCTGMGSECSISVRGHIQTTRTELFETNINFALHVVGIVAPVQTGTVSINETGEGTTSLPAYQYYPSEEIETLRLTFYTDNIEDPINVCEITVITKNCDCPDLSIPSLILDETEFVCGSTYNKCCTMLGDTCPLIIQGKLQTTYYEQVYYAISDGTPPLLSTGSATVDPSTFVAVTGIINDYVIDETPVTITVTFYSDEARENAIKECSVTVNADACCPPPPEMVYGLTVINGTEIGCQGTYTIFCESDECYNISIGALYFTTESEQLWYEIEINGNPFLSGGPIDVINDYIEILPQVFNAPLNTENLIIDISYYEEEPTESTIPVDTCQTTVIFARCSGGNTPLSFANLVIDDNPTGCSGEYNKICDGEGDCTINIGGTIRSNEYVNLDYEITINGTPHPDGEGTVELVGNVATVENVIENYVLLGDETTVCIYFYNPEDDDEEVASCCTTVVRRSCSPPVDDCRCDRCPKGKSILWYGQKRCGKLTSYRVLNQ